MSVPDSSARLLCLRRYLRTDNPHVDHGDLLGVGRFPVVAAASPACRVWARPPWPWRLRVKGECVG